MKPDTTIVNYSHISNALTKIDYTTIINESLNDNRETMIHSLSDEARLFDTQPVFVSNDFDIFSLERNIPSDLHTLPFERNMLSSFNRALNALKAAEKHHDVLTTTGDPIASLLQSSLVDYAQKEGKLMMLSSGLQRVQFDEHDLAKWLKTGVLTLYNILVKRKHEWLKAPATPELFNNNTRLALSGDSGTALYGAPVMFNSIKNDAKGYQLQVTLGDVYYSGTKREVQSRLLDLWPDNANSTSRALNANHEMYSRGYGYFDLILPKFNQKASYFAHQNDNWIVVGLDSAYRNLFKGSLTDDQVDWLHNIVDNAGDRKIILFSHHQPFSLFDTPAEKVVRQLNEFLRAKKIFAWYWGHEHRCIIYKQHPEWGVYGRCVGHGGFPYFRDRLDDHPIDSNFPNATWRKLQAQERTPGGIILDGPNPYVRGHVHKYGSQGYMTLEFDGPRLNEIVHLPDGKIIYERQLA